MSLHWYLVRRLAIAGVVFFGISIVSFAAVYSLPGDPISTRYPNITFAERARIRASLGLDKPLPVQYIDYIRAVAHGDLGQSFNTGNPVSYDLRTRLPTSLELVALAFIGATAIGIPLGIASAVYKRRLPDHVSRILSVAFLSIPVFWLGLIFVFVFYYQLHWAPPPVGQIGVGLEPPKSITGMYIIDTLLAGDWAGFQMTLGYLALPASALGLGVIAPIARITRSAMAEVLEEDYITFARAVGVPEREVVFRDALNNAKVPILTIVGYIVGFLVAGDALIEQIFSWPGIGIYAVQAVLSSDHAAVQGYLLVIAVLVATINLVVDVAYVFIDPRIRYAA